MNPRYALIAALTLSIAHIAPCQPQSNLSNNGDYFPDIPINHWAFQKLQKLIVYGFLIPTKDSYQLFPGDRPGYPRLTRQGVARVLTTVCQNAIDKADQTTEDTNRIGTVPITKASLEAYKQTKQTQEAHSQAIQSLALAYADLIKEFTNELKAIHQDPIALKHQASNAFYRLSHLQVPQPGSALTQFPDVLPTHWAANSILELRKQNILHGYPAGNFTQ